MSSIEELGKKMFEKRELQAMKILEEVMSVEVVDVSSELEELRSRIDNAILGDDWGFNAETELWYADECLGSIKLKLKDATITKDVPDSDTSQEPANKHTLDYFHLSYGGKEVYLKHLTSNYHIAACLSYSMHDLDHPTENYLGSPAELTPEQLTGEYTAKELQDFLRDRLNITLDVSIRGE